MIVPIGYVSGAVLDETGLRIPQEAVYHVSYLARQASVRLIRELKVPSLAYGIIDRLRALYNEFVRLRFYPNARCH
jgi:hypothetical protein